MTKTTGAELFCILNLDELAKTIFSRKGAKDAKKISFNINKLTLRALRLCVGF
jgi:hypothetical protein